MGESLLVEKGNDTVNEVRMECLKLAAKLYGDRGSFNANEIIELAEKFHSFMYMKSYPSDLRPGTPSLQDLTN
jgi:hypothetical protein